MQPLGRGCIRLLRRVSAKASASRWRWTRRLRVVAGKVPRSRLHSAFAARVRDCHDKRLRFALALDAPTGAVSTVVGQTSIHFCAACGRLV